MAALQLTLLVQRFPLSLEPVLDDVYIPCVLMKLRLSVKNTSILLTTSIRSISSVGWLKLKIS